MVVKGNLVLLATFFVVAAVLLSASSLSVSVVYDPWSDIDDNGKINILDVTYVAKALGLQAFR